MASVSIKYVGPIVEDVVRKGCQICDIFVPMGSYTNTPAYRKGIYLPVAEEPADFDNNYMNYYQKSEDGTYVAYEKDEPYVEGKTYYHTGRSVYATNTPNWKKGHLKGLKPMGSNTTPFAFFQRAIDKAIECDRKGIDREAILIEYPADDYKARIYWEQMCTNMVDEGFYCEIVAMDGDGATADIYGTDIPEKASETAEVPAADSTESPAV